MAVIVCSVGQFMLKLIDDSNVCGRDLANDHVGYIDQCDYTYLGDLALLPRQKRINFRWCILEQMCLAGKGVDSWSLAGGYSLHVFVWCKWCEIAPFIGLCDISTRCCSVYWEVIILVEVCAVLELPGGGVGLVEDEMHGVPLLHSPGLHILKCRVDHGYNRSKHLTWISLVCGRGQLRLWVLCTT